MRFNETTIDLTVLNEHASEVYRLIERDAGNVGNESDHDAEHTFYTLTGVSHHHVPFMAELPKLGIAYDLRAHPGYGSFGGDEYCRFDKTGHLRLIKIMDPERSLHVDALHERLASSGPASVAFWIGTHYKKIHPDLSWDNQLEYGKRHRMACLISDEGTPP